MPSLFDVDPDYALKNKDKFAKIAPAMGNMMINQGPASAQQLMPDYAGHATGELAYLGNLLTENPAAFEEIRNKIKIYNAMKSIGIHAAMPKEYGAFNRLDAIIQGKRDPGYTPWESPEMLKNRPARMPGLNLRNPKQGAYQFQLETTPRTLMEI